MLTFDQVSCQYGPIKAIRGVSLNVEAGSIVSLIGANGAGKSTLMMSVFSDPAPSGGRIEFCGENLSNVPTHQVINRGIGCVPEGRRIFSKMTVEENLYIGGFSKEQGVSKEDLDGVYDLFPRLAERRYQRAGTMSGGEQQMLAIGRALIRSPKLLLLDEPSLGLAPLIVKQIFDILRKINQEGTTIFLVEQNAGAALSLCDRAYVLVNGKVAMEGTGAELLSDERVKKAYLGY